MNIRFTVNKIRVAVCLIYNNIKVKWLYGIARPQKWHGKESCKSCQKNPQTKNNKNNSSNCRAKCRPEMSDPWGGFLIRGNIHKPNHQKDRKANDGAVEERRSDHVPRLSLRHSVARQLSSLHVSDLVGSSRVRSLLTPSRPNSSSPKKGMCRSESLKQNLTWSTCHVSLALTYGWKVPSSTPRIRTGRNSRALFKRCRSLCATALAWSEASHSHLTLASVLRHVRP